MNDFHSRHQEFEAYERKQTVRTSRLWMLPFRNERFEQQEAFRFAAPIMAAQACLTECVFLRCASPIKTAARTTL
jgi:hypothetical protein